MTAAMTGAIAGASVGLRGITNAATRLFTDQGTWECENLRSLPMSSTASTAGPAKAPARPCEQLDAERDSWRPRDEHPVDPRQPARDALRPSRC